MKYLDFHLIVLAVLGLAIFGFAFGSQLGVFGVFVAAQFIIFTRFLSGKHREWKRLIANEILAVVLCAVASLAIRS
jgi:hypothetical protein